MKEQFIIGKIGAAHGVHGFLKVHSFSGELDHMLSLSEVTVRQGNKERHLKIEESKAFPPAVLMRFSGFNNPQEAKTLTGAELLVNRSQASPLYEGEFYVEDLKGLVVLAEEGESLGIITDIVEGGGSDLAELKLNDGKIRLVPFMQEFIGEINQDKGFVVLKNLWILE